MTPFFNLVCFVILNIFSTFSLLSSSGGKVSSNADVKSVAETIMSPMPLHPAITRIRAEVRWKGLVGKMMKERVKKRVPFYVTLYQTEWSMPGIYLPHICGAAVGPVNSKDKFWRMFLPFFIDEYTDVAQAEQRKLWEENATQSAPMGEKSLKFVVLNGEVVFKLPARKSHEVKS